MPRSQPFKRKGTQGQPIGSWYGKPVRGPAISLHTRDPKVALERLRLLRAGKWQPPASGARVTDLDDDGAPSAADVVDRVLSGETPPVPPASPTTLPPPPVPPPASPPPPPPEIPEVMSAGPRPAWTDDAAAAAASSPGDGAPPPPPSSPEADRILDLVAEGWVSGCKMLGQWLARRRGLVPHPVEGRGLDVLEQMTVACTRQVIATLLPQVGDLGPEWGMLGGGLAIAAAQLIGATPAPAQGEAEDAQRPEVRRAA